MTHETALKAIRARFKTLITDVVPVATQWDNLPFTKPNDANWVKVTINPGQSNQASLGESPRWRTVGLLIAGVHTRLEKGEEPGHQLADTIATAFRGVSDSGVVFQAPTINRVGRVGGEWLVNVHCPFFFDHIQ